MNRLSFSFSILLSIIGGINCMSIPFLRHKIKYELVRKRNLFQNNGVQKRRRRNFSCFISTLQSSPLLFHVKDSSIRWAGMKYHSQDIKIKSLSKSSMSLKTSMSVQYSSSAANDDDEENSIRRFQFCPDCHGMGKKPSRKHRSKKKRLKNNNVQLLEKCVTCDGTGLVSLSSPSTVQDCNTDYHVSIIGGGIGGMALALALQHRQIPCTIYEKDTHFDERLQGYGLTIQQGNTALTSLGIHQLEGGIYSKRHVVHATNGTILGQWGHRVWVGGDKEHSKNQQSKKQRQNVHIARQKLREILYKQLLVHSSSSSDLIQWGHKFLQYNKNDMDGNNSMEMTFLVDGERKKEKTSIIVGADGIFSNVRKQKFTSPETKMNYLGCIVILGICSTPSKYLDDETVFQTADGTTRLYAMPFSPNSINEFLPPPSNNSTTINNSISNDSTTTTTMWQLSFPMEEEEAIHLSQTRESLHKEAFKRCQSWHEPIPTILKSTPTDLVSGYPVYDRNIPENDYFRKGDDDSSTTVTFIGDAAHPMSPFKGQGANQALLDAVSLARILHSGFSKGEETNLNDELTYYEQEMLKRSSAKVLASAEAAKILHSDVAIMEGNATRGGVALHQKKKTKTTPEIMDNFSKP